MRRKGVLSGGTELLGYSPLYDIFHKKKLFPFLLCQLNETPLSKKGSTIT